MVARTKQQIHTKGLFRFVFVLAILVLYAGLMLHRYGISQGLSVTALTWAFFLFATPIADAGFLLAFPIRLATGFRMLYTQIFVWVLGAVLVAYHLLFLPEAFEKTGLLRLFHDILTTPWPLGIILVLSFVGTYLNIVFDDEVVDVAGAKNKRKKLLSKRHQMYATLTVFVATVLLYAVLLRVTHTNIQWG